MNAGDAPAANARYSHCVRNGRTVYVAGWMGDDPKTGKIVAGGIEKQTVRISPPKGKLSQDVARSFR